MKLAKELPAPEDVKLTPPATPQPALTVSPQPVDITIVLGTTTQAPGVQPAVAQPAVAQPAVAPPTAEPDAMPASATPLLKEPAAPTVKPVAAVPVETPP